ncbi:MAG: hypothetical protein H0T69_00255 [Thermoleophilaceae bacterium]|nr:hypothetical protein [Thermoleophilaceae bacterium]
MSAHGEAMIASRRLDTQVKRERVAAAVDARAATGQELSIAAISRHAGVSRKFIYSHPDLRAQIEQRARQHSRRATDAAVADGRVTVASLRADLANTKAHNHRLRQQLRALEQRLSETLGQEVADELGPGGAPADELRSERSWGLCDSTRRWTTPWRVTSRWWKPSGLRPTSRTSASPSKLSLKESPSGEAGC